MNDDHPLEQRLQYHVAGAAPPELRERVLAAIDRTLEDAAERPRARRATAGAWKLRAAAWCALAAGLLLVVLAGELEHRLVTHTLGEPGVPQTWHAVRGDAERLMPHSDHDWVLPYLRRVSD